MKKPCCSRNRLPAFLNWLNGFMDSWPILVCRFWRLLIISNYAEGGCCSKRGGPHGSSGRNFFQNKLKGKIFLVRTITIFDGKDFQRNLSLQSIHWEFKSFQLAKEWLSLSLDNLWLNIRFVVLFTSHRLPCHWRHHEEWKSRAWDEHSANCLSIWRKSKKPTGRIYLDIMQTISNDPMTSNINPVYWTMIY